MEDKPVLIAGCGYIGRQLARCLQSQHIAVTGCVRSVASARALTKAGITAQQVDFDETTDSLSLAGFNDVFYLMPPPATGTRDTRMACFLDALGVAKPPRRIVYISTSAVYGDCDGAWITESQPTAPTTSRGERRLDAEHKLVEWCGQRDVEWVILRVPGIYGPGKLPLARLKKGLPVLREIDAPYTNRIHGDDLVAVCAAAMQSEHANTIYNVSDGHPGNMTDYFFRIADAAGLPRPDTVTRAEAAEALSAGMLSFLNDSRRMRNDKMLDELCVKLQFPDLQSGLAACFREPE